ncbi:MAG: toxin-antitoxin system HicB family antitoxin [Clostridia bacterium]|jgi:predicted HicB family RNase H-like nuclease|nr:toxin-antitoxin system HicB family antitoxin [Clostridia bacterium]
MFEIDKQETINKTFRIPVELCKKLQEVAQTEGISMNNLVVQCCEYALNDMKPKSKK